MVLLGVGAGGQVAAPALCGPLGGALDHEGDEFCAGVGVGRVVVDVRNLKGNR